MFLKKKTKEQRRRTRYSFRKKLRNKKSLPFFFKKLAPRIVTSFKVNNLFYNLCYPIIKNDYCIATLYWASCGAKKVTKYRFKGTTKVTYMANFTFGRFLAIKVKRIRFPRQPDLFIKGAGRSFRTFWRGFRKGVNLYIKGFDISPISLNGCRLRKKRRV